MALGLNEGMTAQDRADERFIERVTALVGRTLTDDEEETAFACRDQGSYSAEESAIEIITCAA